MNHKAHKDHKANEADGINEADQTGEDKKGPVPIGPATERVVRQVIGAGIAVHRQLGPGFIEPVYHRALWIELRNRSLRTDVQKPIQVRYRGELVCQHRLDLVVEDAVVVEVKAVRKLRRIHQAQILSYLKASGYRVGLLMNFNVRLFVEGLHRFVR